MFQYSCPPNLPHFLHCTSLSCAHGLDSQDSPNAEHAPPSLQIAPPGLAAGEESDHTCKQARFRRLLVEISRRETTSARHSIWNLSSYPLRRRPLKAYSTGTSTLFAAVGNQPDTNKNSHENAIHLLVHCWLCVFCGRFHAAYHLGCTNRSERWLHKTC